MKRNPESVQKDENNPADFGGPVVSPQVTDPRALAYAKQIEERRKGGLPKYTAPVAGGPTPPIPHLASHAEPGASMAAQATLQRAVPEQPSIFGGNAPFPTREVLEGPRRVGGPPPGILPQDLLPEEAKQDPNYVEGMGAGYASSQPSLAFKYGVVRNGQRIPPQLLAGNSGQKPSLRPETLKDLEMLGELQKQRQKAESEDSRLEKESAEGMAGNAASYGTQSQSVAPSSGPAKNVEEVVKRLDDFDYNSFREAMMKDLLNNDDQRKIIEERLQPLDFSDLLTKGFVTQRVPILPGKFEPEFQSMRANEDLAIKRLAMEEARGIEVSERYLLDKFSLMSVTIGLRSINGNPLPDHLDQNGKFSDEKFWKKFEKVASFNFHMLGSIGVNYFWFDLRVRKLFVAESLKNG